MAPNLIPFEESNEKIWNTPAEIFIPAAGSRLITKENTLALRQAGVEVIACGANVPFADQEIFFGPIAELADSSMSLIPDFIANCGMARVFAYLMQQNADLSDAAIFNDTSSVIRKAMEKTYAKNPSKRGIAKTAFEIALGQII